MDVIFSEVTQVVLIVAWIVYVAFCGELYGRCVAEGPASRVARFTLSFAAGAKDTGDLLLATGALWLAVAFVFVFLGTMGVDQFFAATLLCIVAAVLIGSGSLLSRKLSALS